MLGEQVANLLVHVCELFLTLLTCGFGTRASFKVSRDNTAYLTTLRRRTERLCRIRSLSHSLATNLEVSPPTHLRSNQIDGFLVLLEGSLGITKAVQSLTRSDIQFMVIGLVLLQLCESLVCLLIPACLLSTSFARMSVCTHEGGKWRLAACAVVCECSHSHATRASTKPNAPSCRIWQAKTFAKRATHEHKQYTQQAVLVTCVEVAQGLVPHPLIRGVRWIVALLFCKYRA